MGRVGDRRLVVPERDVRMMIFAVGNECHSVDKRLGSVIVLELERSFQACVVDNGPRAGKLRHPGFDGRGIKRWRISMTAFTVLFAQIGHGNSSFWAYIVFYAIGRVVIGCNVALLTPDAPCGVEHLA